VSDHRAVAGYRVVANHGAVADHTVMAGYGAVADHRPMAGYGTVANHGTVADCAAIHCLQFHCDATSLTMNAASTVITAPHLSQ